MCAGLTPCSGLRAVCGFYLQGVGSENTKQGSDSTLGSFVRGSPSFKPALPSPRLKMARLSGEVAGFIIFSWVIIVLELKLVTPSQRQAVGMGVHA